MNHFLGLFLKGALFGLLGQFLLTATVLAEGKRDEQLLLLGDVSAETILSHPAFEPYGRENFPAADIAALQELDTKAVELVLLFGSWCHDSQREVPRLLALLEQLPALSVRAVGVDTRKREPVGLTQAFDLKYTPTLVVLRDGVEVGRIVETPKVNWARDIANLLED